jgi:hypothetical protein
VGGEKRTYTYHYPVIQMVTTDEDVARHAHEIAGLGHIWGPYENRGFKPVWNWTVGRQEYAYALMVALYPWLGARRQEDIRNVLTRWCHDFK